IWIEVYNEKGEMLWRVDDLAASSDAGLKNLFFEGQELTLFVGSFGGGGKGQYTLSSQLLPIAQFPTSGTLEADLVEGKESVYSMELKEGERFYLTTGIQDGP